jgi:hypothetical protein
MPRDEQQTKVEKAVVGLALPGSIGIRAWLETDFAAIQQLSTAVHTPTPNTKANDLPLMFPALSYSFPRIIEKIRSDSMPIWQRWGDKQSTAQ